MTLVYRIAKDHDPKLGPYNSGEYSKQEIIVKMSWAHGDNKHLTPWADHDLNGIEREVEFCALDSMESLKDWFDGFLEGLSMIGYMLYVYRTDSARFGAYGQVVFRMDESTLVSKEALV